MKISQRDAKLLILLLCVLLLGGAYLFGYKKYSDKTDELEKKTEALETEYKELDTSNQHRSEYEAKIKEDNEKILNIAARYPNSIVNADEIYYTRLMEQNSGAWINDFTFETPEIAYTPTNMTMATDGTTDANANGTETATATPADPNATGDEASPQNASENYFVAYKVRTKISFETGYEELKKLIQFVYDAQYRKVIDRMALAVDEKTGLLTGTLEYNSFSIVGLKTTYQPLSIPSAIMGVDNIFGDLAQFGTQGGDTNAGDTASNQ